MIDHRYDSPAAERRRAVRVMHIADALGALVRERGLPLRVTLVELAQRAHEPAPVVSQALTLWPQLIATWARVGRATVTRVAGASGRRQIDCAEKS